MAIAGAISKYALNKSGQPPIPKRTAAVEDDVFSFFICAMGDSYTRMPHLAKQISHDFTQMILGPELLRPVAAPRQSLHKSGVVSRVAESLTEPFDGRVKAVLKVHEGVSGPKFP